MLKNWPSHGMLLCASKDENSIDFLRPPNGSAPGDIVSIGDFPNTPDQELNPKKNPWDVIKDKIFINDKGEASFDSSHIWTTSKGTVTCSSMLKGKIS